MILGLVSCPAIVHCTAGFVLQNGKFSGSGQGRGQGYKSGCIIAKLSAMPPTSLRICYYPPPPNCFLIDFKEAPSTILAQMEHLSPIPPWLHHWLELTHPHAFIKFRPSCFRNQKHSDLLPSIINLEFLFSRFESSGLGVRLTFLVSFPFLLFTLNKIDVFRSSQFLVSLRIIDFETKTIAALSI